MKTELTVFLDLDGVMCDWLNAFRQVNNLPESVYDQFRANPSSLNNKSLPAIYGGNRSFVDQIRDLPIDFWANLNKLPWADQLYKQLFLNKYSVIFLTSPGNCDNALTGKANWVRKHYSGTPLIVTCDKYLCASPNKILIDDTQQQLDEFSKCGGLVYQWANQFELLDYKQPAIDLYIAELIKHLEWLNLRIINHD